MLRLDFEYAAIRCLGFGQATGAMVREAFLNHGGYCNGINSGDPAHGNQS